LTTVLLNVLTPLPLEYIWEGLPRSDETTEATEGVEGTGESAIAPLRLVTDLQGAEEIITEGVMTMMGMRDTTKEKGTGIVDMTAITAVDMTEDTSAVLIEEGPVVDTTDRGHARLEVIVTGTERPRRRDFLEEKLGLLRGARF